MVPSPRSHQLVLRHSAAPGFIIKGFSTTEQRGLCLSGVELTWFTEGQSKVSLQHEIRGARAGNVET